MTTIKEILNNIKDHNNLFENSEFKEWYHQAPASKGKTGEKIFESMMQQQGKKTSERTSRKHDLIVDGKKVEVKTIFKKVDGLHTLYGYDATDDAHWWAILMVEPEMVTVVKMDRNTMGNIYLSNSRKNQIANVDIDDLLMAGGEIIATYNPNPTLRIAV